MINVPTYFFVCFFKKTYNSYDKQEKSHIAPVISYQNL